MAPKPVASRSLTTALASALFVAGLPSAKAAPPIRTSEGNRVPACVTPERLMAFVSEHNPRVDPRFREIARWYKYYGEGWRVRWDYAFFQMLLETNYLSYRRGDGHRGDVWETQNNFAGIGATGGGVRGERFADVKTGVHAQIQHLVAYSGEHLVAPIAQRTRENQDDIIAESNRLRRPVTFADLARRWAADRTYGKSIDFVADLFRKQHCEPATHAVESDVPPEPLPMRREWRYPFRPPSGLGGPKPTDADSPGADASPQGGSEEVLPWLAKPGPSAPAAQAIPQTAAPKKPAAKSAGHAPKVAKAHKSAQKAKKAGVITTAVAPVTAPAMNPASVQTAQQAAEGTANAAATDQPSSQVAAKSDDTGYLPWLPTFRITPERSQPSRLGGPLPAELGDAAKAATAAPAPTCKVLVASYGGRKTLLIRSRSGAEVQYTALTIVEGFERSMFDAYARTEAVGAEVVGEYQTPDAALADARVNCPE